MKKFLMLSVLMMVLGSCGHMMGGHKCEGCKSGKPCAMESKDGQKSECEDCKKGK